MNRELKDENLRSLLEKYAKELPDEGFIERLTYTIVEQRREKHVKHIPYKWPGICILGVLIFFNCLNLIRISFISIDPLVPSSAVAFIAAAWTIILIVRKNRVFS